MEDVVVQTSKGTPHFIRWLIKSSCATLKTKTYGLVTTPPISFVGSLKLLQEGFPIR